MSDELFYLQMCRNITQSETNPCSSPHLDATQTYQDVRNCISVLNVLSSSPYLILVTNQPKLHFEEDQMKKVTLLFVTNFPHFNK